MKGRATRRSGARLLALCGVLVCLLGVSPASASAGGRWRIDSMSNTAVVPGGELTFVVQATNAGEGNIPPAAGGNASNCVQGAPAPADPGKCYTITGHFPPGLKPLKGRLPGSDGNCAAPVGNTITCSVPGDFALQPTAETEALFTVRVTKEAASNVTSTFEVAGAEVGSAATVDPTLIDPAGPQFAVDGFDALLAEGPSGSPLDRAGGHPYSLTTWLDFGTATKAPETLFGPAFPAEPLRDAVIDLPPGLIGNPSVAARCTSAQLGGSGYPLAVSPACPAESQVGRVVLKVSIGGGPRVFYPIPLFNMAPPPGVAARFGFNVLGTMVLLDANLRQLPSGAWTVAVTSPQVSEGLGLPGVETEFWGTPASPDHEKARHCPGLVYSPSAEPYCPSAAPEESFFRMPTSCTAAGTGLPWAVHADSWWNPGAVLPGGAPDLSDPAWKSLDIESHQAPGYPLSLQPSSFPVGYSGPTEWGPPQGTGECDKVPFEPAISVEPSSDAADSPSGIEVAIHMPQVGFTEPGATAESDLKAVSIKLPEGVTVNPSGINGGLTCTGSQIGLESAPGESPAIFSGAPQTCPNASKIGSATVETPLLTEEGTKSERPLHGGVFLAAQHDNPFGSLFALYIVVEDPQSGTIMKLPGRLSTDPATGQIETSFENNPQIPFSELHVDLFGGPRGAVRNPPTCGSYQSHVTLTPWSGGSPIDLTKPYEVTGGPGGTCPNGSFSPHLKAGTANPIAGSFSPFNLQLTRDDGTPEVKDFTTILPQGLLAKLAGIPYCSDAALASISEAEMSGRGEEEHPTCPAASRVGKVTVASGPGTLPFYTQAGVVYLAGPYKGAPLSLAAVTPAVAGPFDLGSVVVRNALYLDPTTAQVRAVTDPIPTILHGVELDLRDIRVELNRPEFTQNPTSCEPAAIGSHITAITGATASPSVRFQVTGCEALPFKPSLALRLSGQTKRSRYPALRATVTAGFSNESNVKKAVVSLPHSEFIAQNHLNHVCTRVQYAEGGGGGAGCPAGSVYGHAIAYTPLLDKPLEGPVYLRSNGGERTLPDLVASLDGQIHVDLVGYIGSNKKTNGIQTTFATVPDAFVSKFVLSMAGGKKGLLENSTDICVGTHKADVNLNAYNGKIESLTPTLKVAGCHGKKKHHRGSRRQR